MNPLHITITSCSTVFHECTSSFSIDVRRDPVPYGDPRYSDSNSRSMISSRYIKTLLTRHCFSRVHRRESDVACNSDVCFWITQHCRDVDDTHTHTLCSAQYIHK